MRLYCILQLCSVALWWTLVLVISGTDNTTCRADFPELANCSCLATVVDCGYGDFTDIPKLPGSTTELVMKHNKITHVESIPAYPDLQLLDLSGNRLVTIAPGAFDELPSLEILLLQTNKLNFSILPYKLFDSLKKLRVLNIGNNRMWRSTSAYRDDLMANLSSVEDLTMDGLRNSTRLGPGFSGLTSLTILTMQAKLKHVSNNTFIDLSELPIETLRLWSGWLEKIDSHAYSCFPNLITLDLSYNPRLGFYDAAKSWPGLEDTKIENLIFNHSSHYNNDIITMNETFLIGLNRTRVKKITLNANDMITMVGAFHIHLPYLEEWAFTYNRLTQVASIVKDVARMDHLIHLDASHQVIRHNLSEKEILAGFDPGEFLEELLPEDVHFDYTQYLVDLVEYNSQLQPLVFDNDRYELSDYEHDGDADEDDDSTDPESLPFNVFLPLLLPNTTETVNLSSSLNIITTRLPTLLIINALSLRYLDYSNNGLEEMEYPIVMVNASRYNYTFSLRDNKLRVVSEYFSDPNTTLGEQTETLLLGNNNMGEMLKAHGAGLFGGMRNLKRLEISNNMIKELPPDSFEFFPLLEDLDLSFNSLRQISFDLDYLPSVRELNMGNNLLVYIDEDSRKKLDAIGKLRHQDGASLMIHLKENPFVCSCETMYFMEWVQHTHNNDDDIHIVDYDALLCEYAGDIHSFKDDMDEMLKTLKRQCNLTNILLLTFLPSAFIALVVAVSVLAWRHKWDIKFWLLNQTIKRKTTRAREAEFSSVYAYDAFVSYSEPQETLRWVTKQLIPNMEQCKHEPKRLLIHDRDFVPGHPVTENILEGIHQSRKIMLIVDRAFLQSNWCKYETHVGHHESIDRGHDIIVAVLLEPESVLFADVNMYQTLKSILRKRTYIEWPQNPLLRDEFWQRLHKAVKNPIMRPLQCVCGRALDRKIAQVDTQISQECAEKDEHAA